MYFFKIYFDKFHEDASFGCLSKSFITTIPFKFITFTTHFFQLLHRPISNLLLSAFDLDPVLTRRLRAISLWTTLQGLGRNAIADRLISAFESCRHLYNAVSVFDDIKILVI